MTLVRACSVDEVTVRPFVVELPDFDVAIVRHGDEFFAIEDLCSHGHVPLSEGELLDGTVECYLHGSTFDLRTGRALNLPATRPVPVFPVVVDGDSLFIDPDSPLTFQEN